MATPAHPPASQGDESTPCTSVWEKHHLYYLSTPVTLLIENKLYRVEKTLLFRFQVFKDMFESAIEFNNDLTEGQNEENPIKIPDVTIDEMDSVLRLFEARRDFNDSLRMGPTEWKAVLYLASMWDFIELRRLAIQKIQTLRLGPLEMLMLSRRCNVRQWLKPVYRELCLRNASITVEEGKVLGVNELVEVARIREMNRDWIGRGRCSYWRAREIEKEMNVLFPRETRPES